MAYDKERHARHDADAQFAAKNASEISVQSRNEKSIIHIHPSSTTRSPPPLGRAGRSHDDLEKKEKDMFPLPPAVTISGVD